jgi:putative ABC transport system permease protein
MGFQVMLMAKGCPYEAATMMLKGGVGLKYLPQDVTQLVLQEPEVEQVTPMLMQAVFDPDQGEGGGIAAYLGIEPQSYGAMKSFLTFRQGGWFTRGDVYEAVMGYEAAELEQREVGDLLLIPGKNVEFKVVGILERTGTQDDGTIFVPLRTLQEVFGRNQQVTTIGIKVNKEADSSRLENRLYELPDVQVVSMAQVKQTILSLVATTKALVLSIATIAIIIAMVGVINTILMSVNERFQEIGILKTIGAMPGDIFQLIWIETLFLCAAGGALGVALSLLLSRVTEWLIRDILPYTPKGGLVLIDANLISLTLGAVLAIGLLSGLYPAWKAGRIRPLQAIRSGTNL